ncbi:mycofactocin biosynthesis glycosyltransferase MftF [Geoalkalibacter halelectricus]|uniref:Mycofactocin biosynthesis glycosyltransferase MftF n=1 Tax=Geoalkalibacter halelectricus TaxID=2847045 RepID=A0ABY5ZMH6_9BACT|nr:mycofactocin biosynthesis glycosyltransferase MftF [Geoalkalibacter halelectricus]MDO3377281.1 mycofactocin biosynthesis glycosyltransferase MftF [Geoalkalibacter halelectricus]UWZ78919.1 mycofactocin biosynthesis glycosyltransferase MftF [Geoalkalibacter halelectricus]
MTYRLLSSVRIEESPAGIFLVAERPYRVLRINQKLADLARRGREAGVAATTPGEHKIWETLVTQGLALREEPAEAPDFQPRVSVVIPVLDRAEDLRKCLESLRRLDYPQQLLEIIVVDDGSRDASPQVAEEFGARLLASGGRGTGPAAARNRGAAAAGGDILAFIDSDCTASPQWLGELLPSFADGEVAAVGGWVDGMNSRRGLDRYETVMSSLNLGGRERNGKEGNDTFYLPSCNLLVRRTAFAIVGGFREDLHVGEDVDLTWRLRDCAYRIVYLPKGKVCHNHRSSLMPFMRRRFDYGTSEGMLQTLHPQRRKKLLLPPGLCVALLLLMLGLTTLQAAVFGTCAAVLLIDAGVTHAKLNRRGLRQGFLAVFQARLRALASLAYYLGYHLLRYYLLPIILLGIVLPQAGLVLALLGLWVVGVDYRLRRPELSLPAFALFYLLEQISYGLGVFVGCWRQRNFSSYVFEFS